MVPANELTLPLTESQIERLKRTEQNPKYHGEGNVYNHTLLVLEQFYSYLATHKLSEEDQEVLYWGAVLHDIGKTVVTKWVDNRWKSHGHEQAGVPIARDILLGRPEISPWQRKRILDLVRWHHIPLRWGLARKDMADYKLMATRTDMRLLGLFAMFDILGRKCVRKQEVLTLILDFNELIVPRIEAEMGSFQAIQDLFHQADFRKKNALWSAYTHGEAQLLEKLLPINLPRIDRPEATCVLTIGTPRSGKTAYIHENFGNYVRFDLREFFPSHPSSTQPLLMNELGQLLKMRLANSHNVVLDGTNMDSTSRQHLASLVRYCDANVHYLFFERSMDTLLARNKTYVPPMDEHELSLAHQMLDIPHPWEAHVLEVV